MFCSRPLTSLAFIATAWLAIIYLFLPGRPHSSHVLGETISRLHRFLPTTVSLDNAHCATVLSDRPCRSLPGAQDVLVVIRTGATEIDQKLPVHLATTLQCIPNYLLFSDYEERFCGHQVHNAFNRTKDNLKLSKEFAFYRDLQSLGKDVAIAQINNSTSAAADALRDSKRIGKLDNPGWALDKYKFLPMLDQTLHLRPDYKWYVFIEPDTFLFWSNLLTWLAPLDASKPHYIGAPMSIGSDLFAYGGAGFILSNSAMHAVVGEYISNQARWDQDTANHWAGDCIVGRALKAAGVNLTWAKPPLITGHPSVVDYAESVYGQDLWCSPAVTYHHLDRKDIAKMWVYEQQRALNPTVPDRIRASDVFHLMINDSLVQQRVEWDGLVDRLLEQKPTDDVETCRLACEGNASCRQWQFNSLPGQEKQCLLSDAVKLGRPAPSGGAQNNQQMVAGWILDRIAAFERDMETQCRQYKDWGD